MATSNGESEASGLALQLTVDPKPMIQSGEVSSDGFLSLRYGEEKRKAAKPLRKSLPVPHGEIFEFAVDKNPKGEIIIQWNSSSLFGSKSQARGTLDIGTLKLTSAYQDVDVSMYTSKDKSKAKGYIKARVRVTKGGIPSLERKMSKRDKKKLSRVRKSAESNISGSGSGIDLFSIIQSRDSAALEEALQRATAEDVNQQEARTGNTPLHDACIEKDEKMVRMLLEYENIRVNVKNTDRNTPLHYFCAKWQSPDISCFDMFIKKGADVNAANKNGETPIFKAIFNNSIRSLLMTSLIEHGAKVDTLNSYGEGILHYAVRMGRADLVNLILQASPRLDIKGRDSLTPHELAVQYKQTKIAAHLKSVEKLFEWLDDNDLSAYKGTFLKNEITFGLLSDITEDLLIRMGVESVGARMKIVKACKKLVELDASMMQEVTKKDDAIGTEQLEDLQKELDDMRPDDVQDWIIDGTEVEYLKKLGSGASGDVYKGLYRGKSVAVKVLKEMTAEQEVDEFKKEFEVLSKIRSPNVIFFYGASFHPRLCMIMEYASRGSLHAVLNDETITIGWDRALDFAIETTHGLNALHSAEPQVLHRDLKSLNLLVTQDWHIKLADFGLSRFDTAENMETMKQMRGTFAYCDPEVYNGARFETSSDTYSFGIILWELAVRVVRGKYETPYSEFKNITFDFQIIVQAAKENLRPTIPPETPKKFADLISACLKPKQEERPSLEYILEELLSMKESLSKEPALWETS